MELNTQHRMRADSGSTGAQLGKRVVLVAHQGGKVEDGNDLHRAVNVIGLQQRNTRRRWQRRGRRRGHFHSADWVETRWRRFLAEDATDERKEETRWRNPHVPL